MCVCVRVMTSLCMYALSILVIAWLVANDHAIQERVRVWVRSERDCLRALVHIQEEANAVPSTVLVVKAWEIYQDASPIATIKIRTEQRNKRRC